MRGIKDLQLKIIYSQRRTMSMELKPDCLIVRAPKGMKRSEIDRFINEKRDWIEKHLVKIHQSEKALGNMKPFTEKEIKTLADKAMVVIPKKVRKYAPLVGVTYGRITIRNQRTIWGSCSGKGNLNFNCLLMLFPDEVIDYVVVHELCHRKQMNHSAAFYREVEKVLPHYRRCQKWLKEYGGAYMRRMP